MVPSFYRTGKGAGRAAVVAALTLAGSCGRPAPHAAASAAMSCTARDSVRTVWDAYLATRRTRLSSDAGARTTYWNAREQAQWPLFDMAMFYLLDGGTLRLTSIDCSDDAHYHITSRFVEPPEMTQRSWYSALNVSVDAERESGRWVLANTLPRLTRDWRRESVGTITYLVDPALQFDRSRAERGMGFADSVSRAFDVSRLAPVTYYVASSLDRVYEIIGLVSEVKSGPSGGLAQPVNRLLFSGIPAIGEEYRHELAHLVLAPLVGGRTTYFISEAVPTWLGGTSGMSYPEAARQLNRFLTARPTLTLDSLMATSTSTVERYTAGAVLVDLVYRAGGTPAVKELFAAGPGDADLRSTVTRAMGRPWRDVEAAWRLHAAASGR